MITATIKTGYIAIELDQNEANEFVLFRKHYFQFKKFLDHQVFESNYTGKVVLDIKDGRIRDFDKGLRCHYEN
jgi:hypothetical protein